MDIQKYASQSCLVKFRVALILTLGFLLTPAKADRPNIVFIMTDDHGTGALSCYGSTINHTPNLDRIAQGGMKLTNCFVTTSLCAPSRASMLTGTYPHINRQVDIGGNFFDGTQPTFPNLMQAEGYQTAVIGKWHLHSIPVGFDHYSVLDGQGTYFDPKFIYKSDIGPVWKQGQGYSTDLITDQSIEWLDNRDPDTPFVLLCHYKSPHYNWEPAERFLDQYQEDLPVPDTYNNRYEGRANDRFIKDIEDAHEFFRIDRWVKEMPSGLTESEQKDWNYQRFMKDYLRCIAAVDENVGRILDYLDEQGLADNTIVVYTSDNGMLQGEHGQIDKQLMQEESIRIPFMVRYPAEIPAGTQTDSFVLNIDFAPTFLDYAGMSAPEVMQGVSARDVFQAKTPEGWREAFYYHFFANYDRNLSLWGIRTDGWKLINYYSSDGEPTQQLFNLKNDSSEVHDLIHHAEHEEMKNQLAQMIYEHRRKYGLTDELLDMIYVKPGKLISIPRMQKQIRKMKKEIDANTIRFNERF
ncbi:MAG: sulfatase [Planctomycetota bacterium]